MHLTSRFSAGRHYEQALRQIQRPCCNWPHRSHADTHRPATARTGTPVHMVVTAEAHHGSDVPVIQLEDVMVYQGRDRVKTTDWIPLQGEHAALELFILLDDASGTSLGSQLEDIRRFINAQPATTRIGVGYMRDGTVAMAQNLTDDHAMAAKSLRLPIGVAGINASPYSRSAT